MKTQSEAIQWAISQEGKLLPWGGYSQCVAFIRNYVDFLGYKQPPFAPGAKDLWTVDWGPEFTKQSSPQPGDIGILGPSAVNKDGHIDIVIEVVPGSLVTMDQNVTNAILGGTTGSPVDKIVWRYPNNRFLGFIRPKFKEESMLTPTQVDKAIKMGLQREPTAEELNNKQYANDPGLLIDTLWNNGGEARYANHTMPAPDPQTVSDAQSYQSLKAEFKKLVS